MTINNVKNKYAFLSPFELDLLYLIAKTKINYKTIKTLRMVGINYFIKSYLKELNIINNNSNYSANVNIDNSDVNTLFLLKKEKMPLDKVYRELKKIEDTNIFFYPNNEIILDGVKKKFFINKIISFAVIAFCFSIFTYGVLNINLWNNDNKKVKANVKSINDKISVKKESVKKDEIVSNTYIDLNNIKIEDVDFKELKKTNNDVKGFLKVNGTTINYPFVQTNDNDYYLEHSFDKSKNKKGWVFLDYRNNINDLDNNTILYAHGAVNNVMFGSLKKVVKKEWYTNSKNYIINLSTEKNNMLFQVFSTYTIEPESYYITNNFDNDEEYEKFINVIKARSVYNYNVDVNTNDKILTLSSCYNSSKRVVLHAKLIVKK